MNMELMIITEGSVAHWSSLITSESRICVVIIINVSFVVVVLVSNRIIIIVNTHVRIWNGLRARVIIIESGRALRFLVIISDSEEFVFLYSSCNSLFGSMYLVIYEFTTRNSLEIHEVQRLWA